MRSIRALLIAATLAALAVPSLATAAPDTCHLDLDVVLDPDVALLPKQAAIHGSGTVACTGGVLAGTNVLTIEATTGPTGHWCPSDLAGTGTLIVGEHESPIATGTFTFGRAGVTGAFDAATTAGTLSGYFLFEPEGDCVVTPVTHAHVSGDALQR